MKLDKIKENIGKKEILIYLDYNKENYNLVKDYFLYKQIIESDKKVIFIGYGNVNIILTNDIQISEFSDPLFGAFALKLKKLTKKDLTELKKLIWENMNETEKDKLLIGFLNAYAGIGRYLKENDI
ncbi:MAG: hypothetical protein C0169_00080 [Thermodesulfobacterium geofontis]|uniref:Uncharacterized protein n=1 Tax=Thermodesulfobacterium geofontis TaxID=1295609 RepID=A0A2N7QGU1_9BACT|nr:MAG: hypothetical protein C0169_00080 [Thermodesulfobacterium geofontis]